MKLRYMVLMLLLFVPSFAGAGETIPAASCSKAHVQSAVTSAQTGDTVTIPAGDCDWGATYVTIDGKVISVVGAGIDVTNLTCSSMCFWIGGVTPMYPTSSDISYLTTIGPHANAAFVLSGEGWRIHHVKSKSGNVGTLAWAAWAQVGRDGTTSTLSTGLLDHMQFVDTVVVSGVADTLYTGSALWATSLGLGDVNAVYIEDSVSTFQGEPDALDCNYGGRVVHRFNEVIDSSVDVHSLQSVQRACRRWEFYYDKFTHTKAPGSGYFMWPRGGTGVIFKNSVDNGYGSQAIYFDNVRSMTNARTDHNFYCTDPQPSGADPAICSTTPSYDLTHMAYCDGGTTPGSVSGWDGSGSGGYPCRDQIGMGGDVSQWTVGNPYPNQTPMPAYIWNNTIASASDDTVTIINGASSFIQANRDYYSTNGASCTAGGSCTSGVGTGTTLPTSCTTNTGFWKTNEGSWNQSASNPQGVQASGADGVLYKCTATDTWTLYYTPYTYPHPLQGGVVGNGALLRGAKGVGLF